MTDTYQDTQSDVQSDVATQFLTLVKSGKDDLLEQLLQSERDTLRGEHPQSVREGFFHAVGNGDDKTMFLILGYADDVITNDDLNRADNQRQARFAL